MKRLLYSSCCLLVLLAAKCGGQPEEKTSEPQEVQQVQPVESTDTPNTDSTDQEAGQTPEEAPVHGSPDAAKLDSIKNSFPKKK